MSQSGAQYMLIGSYMGGVLMGEQVMHRLGSAWLLGNKPPINLILLLNKP